MSDADKEVREARNTFFVFMWTCLTLMAIALSAGVVIVGIFYVRMQMQTPEGLENLVRDALGVVGVSAVTLVVEHGVQRIPRGPWTN